jgi:hypothetical protein
LRLIELLEQHAPNQLKEFIGAFSNDPEEMIRERAQATLQSNSPNLEVNE